MDVLSDPQPLAVDGEMLFQDLNLQSFLPPDDVAPTASTPCDEDGHGRDPEPGCAPERQRHLYAGIGLNLNELLFSNPAVRVFKSDAESFGKPKDFPYAATSYRLTEHFHYWTKHSRLNAILQPQQFVEIGEALANEIGVANGANVKVSSNRGHIVAVAMVTKRIRPLTIEGKTVHTVGIPIHWGFTGVAKAGFLANSLTPVVGDGNSQTPEFKSFLVKVEKA